MTSLMTASKTLRTKTIALLVLMVLFGSAGDVLLSKGMKHVGAVEEWSAPVFFSFFFRAFATGTIWLGIGCLLLFLVCDLLVLSWADYSFVSPASAAGYAVVPLLGYVLLGENVTSVRWLGVIFICLGVILVSLTAPRTTTVESAVTSRATQAQARATQEG